MNQGKLFWYNRNRILLHAWEYLKYFYSYHHVGAIFGLSFLFLSFTLAVFIPEIALLCMFPLTIWVIWFYYIADNSPFFATTAMRMITLHRQVFGEYISAKELDSGRLIHFETINPSLKKEIFMVIWIGKI